MPAPRLVLVNCVSDRTVKASGRRKEVAGPEMQGKKAPRGLLHQRRKGRGRVRESSLGLLDQVRRVFQDRLRLDLCLLVPRAQESLALGSPSLDADA